jgi:NAD(P)-dependent dehydrogenase (short-subunit alcohol dehydrogenase family)
MSDLRGKVAVVTGAGRGIGRGIAIAYARAGAKVLIASRTKFRVDQVVEEITKEGGTALGLECDVGERAQVFDMIEKTVKAFGAVDILVNNAQAFTKPGSGKGNANVQPLESFDEEDWETVYRTGLLATLWAMKAVFPHMKNRGGRIINFASPAAQMGLGGFAAYNATKEAIRGLSRTGAREWGKYSINVNIISPVVLTDGLADVFEGQTDKIAAAAAPRIIQRWGDPVADAGGLAVFLASPASSYLTGMTFMLDGGEHMWA